MKKKFIWADSSIKRSPQGNWCNCCGEKKEKMVELPVPIKFKKSTFVLGKFIDDWEYSSWTFKRIIKGGIKYEERKTGEEERSIHPDICDDCINGLAELIK